MTVKQAIKILKYANRWRRGAEIEMPDVKEFGEAIDVAVVMLEVALKTDPVLNRHNINTKRYD